MKKTIFIIILTLILAGLLFLFLHQSRLDEAIHWKIYEKLLKTELNFRPPAPAIKDVLLVTIGNETLTRLKKRWPLPRSDFARVINNLGRAGAKVIAFDFVFLGESTPEEDAQLRLALENNKVVLATAIDENTMIELFSLPDLTANIPAGFITKLQDRDGITRRNLTYLVNERNPTSGLLSWEMQILRVLKDIDLNTLKTIKGYVYFCSRKGERWSVPVNPNTGSFLIHFRAHTIAFRRISFYRVLNNDFDISEVKDKIVLIGPASSLLGDMHLTPIGWLPGLTLNANAFLNLYARDFIRPVPVYAQYLILIVGLILSAFAVARLRDFSGSLLIIMEIIIFFLASYLLIARNYTWNYSLFPVLIFISPLWARRLYKLIEEHKKHWT